MAQVAGITVAKNYNGTPKSITFNYKMYGDLLTNFFTQEGLDIPFSAYNKKEVENLINSEIDMRRGIRKEVDMSNFWG